MAQFPKLTEFEIFNSRHPAIPLGHLKQLKDKYNFGAIHFEDYIHIASNLMKQDSKNNNIEILKAHINLETAVHCYKTEQSFNNYFKNIWAGIYNPNLHIERCKLVNLLNRLLTKQSIIFMYVNLYEYDMGKDQETNHNIQEDSHAVAIILLPITKGRYKAVYFNPHGNKMKEYTCFKTYHTRMRTRDYEFGESIDMVIMDNLVKYFNSCIPDMEIEYEKTEKYNYIGANLQSADNIGICYIFPFYLFHQFCYHLREQHILRDESYEKEHRFVSYYSLLKSGQIDMVIYIILSNLLTNFNKLFIKNLQYSYIPSYFHDKMIKDVEELFGENEEFYIHCLMYPGIGYLLQPAIKKIIVGE